jgi:hypothetical protein
VSWILAPFFIQLMTRWVEAWAALSISMELNELIPHLEDDRVNQQAGGLVALAV